ncbi:hypothetical protein HMPREF1978_01865 [Actinomyces graevenitzii F0530]|uniref:Uncharacterized protein n=1 Tax=Actinomyces graevenitzii F0530 TaxID=1321817 RepID=U1R3M5_9ACTO|nr:hypothetical protein HMPREF1978_01865 [Actinomyces graevenitzii F0530]
MVFPAHAGMSPASTMAPKFSGSFPRSRGDEPFLSLSSVRKPGFSPLTWG